jgi:hypothetical protein
MSLAALCMTPAALGISLAALRLSLAAFCPSLAALRVSLAVLCMTHAERGGKPEPGNPAPFCRQGAAVKFGSARASSG